MKKFLMLFVSLMLMSISLNAFEPIRISITSTPSTTANLKVDILTSSGTLKLAILDSNGVQTNAAGSLSLILNNDNWDDYGTLTYTYSESDLLRITFNSVVLSIERMEVVISKQSLYGATISPDEIDQTDDFTFKKIGILESGTTPTYYTYLQGGDQDNDITYSLPIDDGTSGQVLSTNGTGTLSWVAASGSGSYWTLSGNSGTTPGTNFIGTTDDKALVFKVNAVKAGELSSGTNTSFGYQTLSANTGQWNSAFGSEALTNNTSGDHNTAIGQYSMNANTEGYFNTAVGQAALRSNVYGDYNSALGQAALSYNTTGSTNTAIGNEALFANTSGNYNTAVGYQSLDSNKANSRSTALGYQSMNYADDRTTGRETYNTAVGYQALYGSTTASANTGQYNTAIGDQAMWSNTSGSSNTANGVQALYSNTSGEYNVSYGYQAMYSNNQGRCNSSIGYRALYSNQDGDENSVIGLNALYDNINGSNNVAIGCLALRYNTSGSFNTAVGYQTLFYNKANSRSTAIGRLAMYYADDRTSSRETFNTAVGYGALYGSSTPANNTGQYNTAVGDQALHRNTSGSCNSATGVQALYDNNIGYSNTAFGYVALTANTGGYRNTGVGQEALGANTSGYNNSALGWLAGYYITNGSTLNQTSNTSVYIGSGTRASANGNSNEIVIGSETVGAGTNSVTLGNTSVATTVLRGNVRYSGSTSGYIGLASPASPTSYNLVLPASQGGTGTGLINDGAGNLSWTDQGATYRWATFTTYSPMDGWACNDSASLFGGITPSNWTNGSAKAYQMSSNKDILRTLFTNKGYAKKNATIINDDWMCSGNDNGKVFLVLFRIKNNTTNAIIWRPSFYYSAYSPLGELASVTLNGVDSWSANSSGNTTLTTTLSIPASRVSTVIFVSTSGNYSQTAGNDYLRNCRLVFYNHSLSLPAGLEFIDDLDTATGDWTQ